MHVVYFVLPTYGGGRRDLPGQLGGGWAGRPSGESISFVPPGQPAAGPPITAFWHEAGVPHPTAFQSRGNCARTGGGGAPRPVQRSRKLPQQTPRWAFHSQELPLP